MTITELLARAEEVSNEGVPVDWRQLCHSVFSHANNHAAQLEQELQTARNQVVRLQERLDGEE
jgi:hypothetical protein